MLRYVEVWLGDLHKSMAGGSHMISPILIGMIRHPVNGLIRLDTDRTRSVGDVAPSFGEEVVSRGLPWLKLSLVHFARMLGL